MFLEMISNFFDTQIEFIWQMLYRENMKAFMFSIIMSSSLMKSSEQSITVFLDLQSKPLKNKQFIYEMNNYPMLSQTNSSK